MQYLVTVLNAEFKGKTLGVQFSRGRAILDPATIDPTLGLDVDEVAKRMEQEYGYDVKALSDEPEKKPHRKVDVKGAGEMTADPH